MDLETREEKLREIERFSKYTDIMFYRSNVFSHSRRVFFIVKKLNQYIKNSNYDSKKAEILALMHDDEEMFTGDVMAYKKAQFSDEEKDEYMKKQFEAIDLLVEKFGEDFGRYSYGDLLKEIVEESSLEFKVVDFADKFDCFNEVCHEILSGNLKFLVEVEVNGESLDAYDFTFGRVKKRFEELKEFFDLDFLEELLVYDENFNDNLGSVNLINDFEKLKSRTEYSIYNFWINLIEEFGEKQDFMELINIKEYEEIEKGIYEHYKGEQYEVLGESLHTESDERLVLYKPLYDIDDQNDSFNGNPYFIRPKNMFLEKIELNGNLVNRFKLVK